jgi:hypothetical protein
MMFRYGFVGPSEPSATGIRGSQKRAQRLSLREDVVVTEDQAIIQMRGVLEDHDTHLFHAGNEVSEKAAPCSNRTRLPTQAFSPPVACIASSMLIGMWPWGLTGRISTFR